ncbi:MAG: LysR family transcriptional regulator [Acidimicrobiaceae bacterium]|nr:LysR family transcriptional regulator [Acidimicrobiaceae bacterium]
MELRQLEYLVAVAEEANFTRAADRVNVTQSGVSAQVRQLERELGQPLFDRSGRTVRLTEVGAAVLPFARAALDAAHGARFAVDQLAGLVHGKVSIGMVSGCSLPLLARLLADFHTRSPGVDITLIEGGSDRLVDAICDGTLDLALVGASGDSIPGVRSIILTDEALVAAVAPSSPLASRQTITVEALEQEPIISLPRGTGVRAAFDAACSMRGVTPHIVFEATALLMVAQLAAQGLGVAILPTSIAESLASSLHSLRLRPQIRSRLELVWKPAESASPAAKALLDHVLSGTPSFIAVDAPS